MQIKPIDPINRPFFAGEVSGVDITRPLSPSDVAAISAGMDQTLAAAIGRSSVEIMVVMSRPSGWNEKRR